MGAARNTYCWFCGYYVPKACEDIEQTEDCPDREGSFESVQFEMFPDEGHGLDPISVLRKAKKPEEEGDPVVLPKHYTRWKLEPITFIMENNIPWCEANAIKYLMRWRDKNGLEDLKKARRYIDMLIAKEYGEGA